MEYIYIKLLLSNFLNAWSNSLSYAQAGNEREGADSKWGMGWGIDSHSKLAAEIHFIAVLAKVWEILSETVFDDCDWEWNCSGVLFPNIVRPEVFLAN